jgi:hypothetical protein
MRKKEFGKEGSDGYVEDPMEIGSGITILLLLLLLYYVTKDRK